MWEHGKMGEHNGWHLGQARDMMREMHEHARGWDWPHWHHEDHDYDGGGLGGLLGSFIDSFADKIGANAADHVLPGVEENR